MAFDRLRCVLLYNNVVSLWRSFVTASDSLYLFRVEALGSKNRLGHCSCRVSTGRTNGLTSRTRTHRGPLTICTHGQSATPKNPLGNKFTLQRAKPPSRGWLRLGRSGLPPSRGRVSPLVPCTGLACALASL